MNVGLKGPNTFWSLKKKDILKLMNQKSRRVKFENIEKNLDIETKKKVKTILFCMNSKKVANLIFVST